MTAVSNHHKTG